MGLSSKLILASKKAGTLINWQGNASLALTYAGIDACVYSYTRAYQDEGEGSLSPLLQTVKNDTQIYNLTLAVDPNSIMLFEAALYFYNLPRALPRLLPKGLLGCQGLLFTLRQEKVPLS